MFAPPFEGDAISALSHSASALPFPRQLFKWKYCGLSNAANSGSNPGSGIYELNDQRRLLHLDLICVNGNHVYFKSSWVMKGHYICAPEFARWSVNMNSFTLLETFSSLPCLTFILKFFNIKVLCIPLSRSFPELHHLLTAGQNG